MSTFTVTAERTAKWWVLQAVEAPGAISQVARLDQVAQIKEALAFVTGESEEDIEIDVRFRSLPPRRKRIRAFRTSARTSW